MSVLIEVGGAESGFIGLIEDENCVIRVATDKSSSSPKLTHHVLDDSHPQTIVNYTTRTERTLNIVNASEELPFSYDPYVIKHKIKSVFCHPLIWQGNLLGLLYLENNLAESLFSDRALILELLSGQVVSSLENARLQERIYKNIEPNEKTTVYKKDIQFIKDTLNNKKSSGLNSQDIEQLLEVLSNLS